MAKTFPNSRDCPGQVETVHRFLDGDLPAGDRRAFSAHLQQCPACRTLLDGMETLFSELDSLADVAPPAGLVNRVMDGLPAQAPASRRVRLGQVVIAGQVGVGLALLLALVSAGTPALNPNLLRLPWLVVARMLGSLSGWLGALAVEWGHRLYTWWQISPPAGFTISPEVGISLALALGLAWLIGNTVLLRGPSQPKNGGVR